MKKLLAMVLSAMLAALLLNSVVFAEDTAEEAEPETAAVEEEAAASDLIPVPEVNLSENGELILEDYSEIEIPKSVVEVSEFEVDAYIQSILDYATTTEEITEGTAEEGDLINIDFSGVLEGEDEPRDGMVAEGFDITLGSGTFIPGFEEQMIGHAIGETFDVNVTFPEDYTEDLAGKNAVFTVTINSKNVSVVPELTDEFVQTFASENLDTELNSVEELTEYTKEYLFKNYLQNALMSAMQEKDTVISYNESQFELMKAYSAESLAYNASMYAAYGMDDFTEDSVAQMYGFENAEAYTTDEAMYYTEIIMLLDKIAEEEGISYTDEEVDETIAQYMKSYGYDGVYDVEQFKEMSGEAWVLLISKLNVEYEKDMDALESHVVYIDDAEETAAADEPAEEVPAADEPAEEVPAAEGLMNYADYNAAAVDDEVTVAMYVQATQSWWEDTISVYAADPDGAYFVYNLACSEEDAARLTPGTKIIVNGYKSEWSGEVEIADATFTFAEEGDTFLADVYDVTDLLGSDELADHMNQYVSFNGLTVEASADADGNEAPYLYNWDGSGTQGDDLYFNASLNGTTFTFTVESYLCGPDTDVYQAVEGLQVGDVIDMEGFLYWYNGANPHITSVTVQ